MRLINIHGFEFNVLDEPADYWGWIESGHYKTDFATIKAFANPDATCVDLGAWIGADTLYASRLFKYVHAVEADPVAVQMLIQNVVANNLQNVQIHDHAIMGHNGTTTMGGALLGCSCTRETCAENAVTVPCMTLRDFCKDIQGPLFIKMDVEGAEAQILKDWQFFAERKPDMMLSTHAIWWEEGGSNCVQEFATVSRVARLYKHVLTDSRTKVDLNRPYGDIILTNKDIF
jgi:FkbM family methyltransferase